MVLAQAAPNILYLQGPQWVNVGQCLHNGPIRGCVVCSLLLSCNLQVASSTEAMYWLCQVGLACCIGMVLLWNQLAGGSSEFCAILVAVNSVLQIILFSPLALFYLQVGPPLVTCRRAPTHPAGIVRNVVEYGSSTADPELC